MSPTASPSSRLAPARRRAKLLKLASAGAAVVGFGVLSVIVRGGTHSGTATATTNATSAARASGTLSLSSRISQEASQASSSFFNSGSVTPTQSSSPAPQAATSTS